MNGFNFDKFFEDSKNLTNKDSYLISYKHIISFFASVNELSIETFIICVHVVYGWMPTIPSLHGNEDKMQEIVALINCIKKNKVASIEDLDAISSFINNSIVGTSKLLHFLMPDIFAIYDSKVFRYLNPNKEAYQKDLTANVYLEYMKLLEMIILDKRFHLVKKDCIKKIGYEVTDLRVAELVMFQNAPERLRKNKTNSK